MTEKIPDWLKPLLKYVLPWLAATVFGADNYLGDASTEADLREKEAVLQDRLDDVEELRERVAFLERLRMIDHGSANESHNNDHYFRF